jgi:hypothetical protein
VRALAKFVRRYIRAQYIKHYRRARPLDDATLDAWRIPVAGERLADGIDDEREKLLSMLYAAMNASSPPSRSDRASG